MKLIRFVAIPIMVTLACSTVTPAATEWPAIGTDTNAPPLPTSTSEIPQSSDVDVWVFFTMAADENMTPVPIARSVPDSGIPAELVSSTLKELLRGPTDAEKNAGLTSWFSSATADAINQVAGVGSEYTVDFTGLNVLIPNASTSAGSQMLLSQLNSTMFQFDFVQTVQYTLGGDCAAFWEWLQSGCHSVTRAEWEAG